MTSASLEEYTVVIRHDLLKLPILHADETEFRVKGERWWFHSISKDNLGEIERRYDEIVEREKSLPISSGKREDKETG